MRVDHDEQLHQVVVHRGAGGLHDKDIGPAHALLDEDARLAIAILIYEGRAKGDAQMIGYRLGQCRVCVACEYLQVSHRSQLLM